MESALLMAATKAGSEIARATITELHPDGTVMAGGRRCELTDAARVTAVDFGDDVLVWLPAAAEELGVVLGRIGPPRVEAPTPEEPPAVLVLEARRSLVLRVGDGSITIREDGRILIKGKDLVSHAQRTNRIKGGSVAIN